MAKVRTRRLFWTASDSPDVVGYVVYAFPANTPNDQALAAIENSQVTPIGTPSEPQFFLEENALPGGDYDFYVSALDARGNESDPLFSTAWNDVTIDVTPPNPPTGGGIE